jgi:DNA-binding Lrp family transcriptional regulator
MDAFDLRILKILQEDANLSLKEIGLKVGLFSPSAVSKRIKNLQEQGYIKKIHAEIDYSKLGFGFQTLTMIRGKYGPNYKETIASKLSKIPGVVSIYFLLGDVDFIIYTITRNKNEYTKILDMLSSIPEIERSDTRTILEIHKEMDFSLVDMGSQYPS